VFQFKLKGLNIMDIEKLIKRYEKQKELIKKYQKNTERRCVMLTRKTKVDSIAVSVKYKLGLNIKDTETARNIVRDLIAIYKLKQNLKENYKLSDKKITEFLKIIERELNKDK